MIAMVARRAALALALVLLVVPSMPLPAQEGSTEGEATESGIEERIEVNLVEIKVRATDKDGRPVTDLRPDEIEVFQSGDRKKLAYFEVLATRDADVVRIEDAAKIAPLYDQEGNLYKPDTGAVMPAEPRRRIVVAFDPMNSKSSIRDDWRAAAIDWAKRGISPGDEVGILVLRPWPDWVVPLTGDLDRVRFALEGLDLYSQIPSRSRRDQMTDFINEMRMACGDYSGGRGTSPSTTQTGDLSADEAACAFELARPWVRDWHIQTMETADTLKTLSGQLGAIPGQKSVILFSEGMVQDPAMVAVHGMMSLFGPQTINMASMHSRLRRDTDTDLTSLQERATAADVTFFTLDTRHSAEGSDFASIEDNAPTAVNTGVISPWREMYESTRSSLSALAYATGGKPYYGPDGLSWKIRMAADSYFGLYALGYYTDDPGRGKVKVKVTRKKVRLDYQDRARPRYEASRIGMELLVGRPTMSGADDAQLLPLALLTELKSLPLRKGAGGFGCELGVFVQAIRPDGKIAGELFQSVPIVVDAAQHRNPEGRTFRHEVELPLTPGPYRIRVRLSDDRHEVLADRSIDLTLAIGDVRAGLESVPSS